METMAERIDRNGLELQKERCFLAGAIVPGRFSEHEEPLSELAALVDTAGGQIVGRITQRLERPHSRSYLNKGKLEELATLVNETEADTVVVDDDLSPKQLSAIEAACQRKVIDRSEVILDIFVSRARSHQAKLQVELAQLQYELPRLARKWTHLERLGGGIGTRGPGESQIETDRRILRRKISFLREKLDEIEARKAREVSSRSTVFSACLVGYTNAGKSSLLNCLTGAGAYVEDKLFATLDTLTRKLEIENAPPILLSDTVGFIRRLPHHLVASFHATLEEAAQSDLLLHVIDGADQLARRHIESVEQTLRSLGMDEKPRAYIFNKCDVATDRASLEGLASSFQSRLIVSAHTREGIPELLALLAEKAQVGQVTAKLRFPAADGRRFSLINQLGQVRETTYDNADAIITATFEKADFERVKKLPGMMEVLS
jgi:GTP-binding protein HflX